VDGKSLRNAAGKDATVSRASDARRLDFPRACRLVRRAEYDAVYREGRRRSSREFTVFLRPNGLGHSRFGWSIKKALGGAVRRNRIRRRLREIVRLHRQEISPGWDIVIHPRSSAATADFPALAGELWKLLPREKPARNSKD
jgi:ribonuclease P protein component